MIISGAGVSCRILALFVVPSNSHFYRPWSSIISYCSLKPGSRRRLTVLLRHSGRLLIPPGTPICCLLTAKSSRGTLPVRCSPYHTMMIESLRSYTFHPHRTRYLYLLCSMDAFTATPYLATRAQEIHLLSQAHLGDRDRDPLRLTAHLTGIRDLLISRILLTCV